MRAAALGLYVIPAAAAGVLVGILVGGFGTERGPLRLILRTRLLANPRHAPYALARGSLSP